MTAAGGKSFLPSLLAKVQASVDVLYREVLKFGAVGAIASWSTPGSST